MIRVLQFTYYYVLLLIIGYRYLSFFSSNLECLNFCVHFSLLSNYKFFYTTQEKIITPINPEGNRKNKQS